MFTRYGFIVKAEGHDYQNDTRRLATLSFTTDIVGVSSDDDAILAAREMIANGVEVIELCGGFGAQSADYIIASLDSTVPIGFVSFSDSEQQKLQRVMALNTSSENLSETQS